MTSLAIALPFIGYWTIIISLDVRVRRKRAARRAAIAGEAQRGETTEIGSTGTASTRAEGIAQPRAA